MFKIKKDYVEYENKSLRLPKDLIDKVQTLANENNLSFNKVVIQCIEYALDYKEDDEWFWNRTKKDIHCQNCGVCLLLFHESSTKFVPTL